MRLTRENLAAFAEALIHLRDTATDEAAAENPAAYDEWEKTATYAVGERVQHAGVLYKCVQAHTAQEDWTPDLTPALWARVSVDQWPEWVQPLGAADAYMAGDKVSHGDKRWINASDYNIYEPGVWGWEEANE